MSAKRSPVISAQGIDRCLGYYILTGGTKLKRHSVFDETLKELDGFQTDISVFTRHSTTVSFTTLHDTALVAPEGLLIL
ncbi:hypothetical protein CRM22_000472 [Opisthorchis felineus]|uniref:Uncharacterized protein n=1 Tax=Opisthorchis felineus TaxID=147828 RepID=A0A4S2MEV2_OPIFE|nr:hypothetical protein CRM22_000472 [Opisthorchis felineus]